MLLNELNKTMNKKIVVIFSIISIIDSLNGFIMNTLHIPVPLGQIYRCLIIMMMLYIILKYKNYTNNSIPFLLIAYLVGSSYFYYLIYFNVKGFAYDFTESLKIVFIILIIEAFRNLYLAGKIGLEVINKILSINFFLFPLTVIIPKILGIGYSNYSDSTGYQAFYNANNDLNIVMIILLIFGLNELFIRIEVRNKYFIYLVFNLLTLLSLVLIGSKTSIIIGTLTLLIFIARSLNPKRLKSGIKSMAILGFIVTVLIVIMNSYYSDQIKLMTERYTYFWQKQTKEESSPVSFFLTSRDLFLSAAIKSYNDSDHKEINFLFGQGRYNYSHSTAEEFGGREKLTAEMDFFDIFFAHGSLGTMFIYLYFTVIGIKGMLSGKLPFKMKYAFIIVALFSFFGGHVFYSALSGTFLALLLAYIRIHNEQNSKSKVGYYEDPYRIQHVSK